MATIKKTDDNNASEDTGRAGAYSCEAPTEISMGAQHIKPDRPHDQQQHSGRRPNRLQLNTFQRFCIFRLTVALFTKAKIQIKTRCRPTNEWINKIWDLMYYKNGLCRKMDTNGNHHIE